MLQISDSGIRSSGFADVGFRVQRIGSKGLGFMVHRAYGLGFGVKGLGFRVKGLGFRV
jgi:hypothetical protein